MKPQAILAKYSGPALCALLFAAGAAGQELPVILDVQIENAVGYTADMMDPSKVARTPGPVIGLTAAELGNFWRSVGLGDVTAINGSPAKGVAIWGVQALVLRPVPTPTQAIADVQRASRIENAYEFLKPDGTSFATIYTLGLFRAGATIGAIVGGTGAFEGARGSVTQQGGTRNASQAEDPSMRRINGGGQLRHVFQIFPMFRPEVLIGLNGPVIIHSDYSAVTSDKPARPGEVLILYAKGLGPTTPSVPLPGRTLCHRHLACGSVGQRETLAHDQPGRTARQQRCIPRRLPGARRHRRRHSARADQRGVGEGFRGTHSGSLVVNPVVGKPRRKGVLPRQWSCGECSFRRFARPTQARKTRSASYSFP